MAGSSVWAERNWRSFRDRETPVFIALWYSSMTQRVAYQSMRAMASSRDSTGRLVRRSHSTASPPSGGVGSQTRDDVDVEGGRAAGCGRRVAAGGGGRPGSN